MLGVTPEQRLLFWLRVPFAADVVLVPVGVGLLVGGRSVGWWVLVFAAGRFAVNIVALWLAHRMLRRRGGSAGGVVTIAGRRKGDSAPGDRDGPGQTRDQG